MEDLKATVKQKFIEYLELKGQRKTPERFAILEEIYSKKEHFDVERLYDQMKERNYRVSRATVYNTLDLLLECGLVARHQFGENMAVFEQAYGYKQHDHMICNHCTKILEFCDPRIQQIQNMIGGILNFNITSHSLNLYGEPQTNKNGKCINCNKLVPKK
ncbi:MAG: transcriptional repressor [Bacteroidota bacterium]|nr:transcriptional repressor [Bacteroidota bacterium]